VVGSHIARGLDRVNCFDLPIVEFLHHMHRGSSIERGMREEKNKGATGLKKLGQGSEECFDSYSIHH
jgi:hypothetical protein